MEQDKHETLTVFRKFKDGDVIALFPDTEWTAETCSSYMRVGQHGGADYQHVLSITTKATPFIYEGLKQELESIGYNLKIRQKWMRRANQ